jgi:hypothetical protein
MEDTRTRWQRAFNEATDYDTWGQVTHFHRHISCIAFPSITLHWTGQTFLMSHQHYSPLPFNFRVHVNGMRRWRRLLRDGKGCKWPRQR